MIGELSEYWKTEEFKLQQIKTLIESLKSEPGIRELYDLSRDERYNVVTSPPEGRDYESNLFAEFVQFDGCKAGIGREVHGDLTTITDAIFYSSDGKEIFKLSGIIPEGYTIIEGRYIGRDFMNPTFRCIVLQTGFLESVGGRLSFLHEVGHAFDYVENPQSKEEFVSHLKGLDSPERENEAWKYSRQILEKMKQRGLKFFPDWFEEAELEKWIEFCKKNHNYPEIN